MFNYQTIINEMITWSLESGTKIIGVVIVTLFLRKFGETFIEKVLAKTMRKQSGGSEEARERRLKTLTRIFSTTFNIIIILIAGMIILSELGINITPIIAGAGIVGVAVGFGGQYLIKDLISGIFIIMDNQYRVGDVVCFDKTCGSVEDISLRMTVLRDMDGTVHHIPNGEVRIASNFTKGFSRLHLNISIPYDTNLEKVIEIVNKVGQEMAEDEDWKNKIITPPAFLRVDLFAETSLTIKIVGDTKTLSKWEVEGEYRKRLKQAFDKHDIEMVVSQRIIQQSIDIKTPPHKDK